MVTRSTLIYLSEREGLKEFATKFRPFKKLTTRFIAGETIKEPVDAIRQINAEGCTASFDHLNESVTRAEETQLRFASTFAFSQRLMSRESVQMFPSSSTSFVSRWIRNWLTRTHERLCSRPANVETLLRIDMEGIGCDAEDDRYL